MQQKLAEIQKASVLFCSRSQVKIRLQMSACRFQAESTLQMVGGRESRSE